MYHESNSDIKNNLKLFQQLFNKLVNNIAQAYQVFSLWELKKGGCKNIKSLCVNGQLRTQHKKLKQKKPINKVNNYKVKFQSALLAWGISNQ